MTEYEGSKKTKKVYTIEDVEKYKVRQDIRGKIIS